MPNRTYTAQEKYQILEEARQPGASIAEICRRHQMAASLYYKWEKAAKQAVMEALNGQKRRKKGVTEEQELKEKITQLRMVISEITEENLTLKKALGE